MPASPLSYGKLCNFSNPQLESFVIYFNSRIFLYSSHFYTCLYSLSDNKLKRAEIMSILFISQSLVANAVFDTKLAINTYLFNITG